MCVCVKKETDFILPSKKFCKKTRSENKLGGVVQVDKLTTLSTSTQVEVELDWGCCWVVTTEDDLKYALDRELIFGKFSIQAAQVKIWVTEKVTPPLYTTLKDDALGNNAFQLE